MSAMSLYLPDILMVVRCEACAALMHMPRKRRRCPAASDDPDLSLNFHPTAEVLSQKRAVWVFYRLDVRHSIIIQLKTSHAIWRSFIVRVTSLNGSFTFCGQSHFHMIGPILFRPDV